LIPALPLERQPGPEVPSGQQQFFRGFRLIELFCHTTKHGLPAENELALKDSQGDRAALQTNVMTGHALTKKQMDKE